MQHSSGSGPDLERRLAAIERQARWMRWGLVLLVSALLGSCARKPVIPAEIVAREFKVLDDEGNVYASLGVAPWNPEGALTLLDRTDRDRRGTISPAKLTLDGGASVVRLEAGADARLVMHDRKDWTGAKLSMHPGERKSALWLTSGRDSIYRNP